tara:strand:+ start:4007 stop:4375 length:369 start_codon:yes stop_codon:yes gene_type:complete
MAEGWCRALFKDTIEAYSAGTKKHGMNERAVKVMNEVGINLSNHSSKTIEELPTKEFDLVITVCSDAHETCPYFPGKVLHFGFDDPPRLTKNLNDEEEVLKIYRRVRDEIGEFVKTIPSLLN